MSSKATLKEIQHALGAITNGVPYCSGSVPVEPATSPLFYLNNGKAGYVDFARPTEAQLVALAEACQPETSSVHGKEDVVEESSRKAGKMDTNQFSTQFSPLTNGIIGTVKSDLLRGRMDGTGRSLLVELDRLDVYGPGSSIKAHSDSEDSFDMFASTLVVILPTVHEGGSLILRHRGKEKVFDTARAVTADQETPHAVFVASRSGVKHEVSPVKSGYRVTLTYNLYLACSTDDHEDRAPGPSLDNTLDQRVTELQGLMKNLLQDPTFLPDGGYLGFGLSHKYTFDQDSFEPSGLVWISDDLKGGDRDVKRVCEALGLNVSLKAIYADWGPMDKYPCCLLDHFFEFEGDVEVGGDILTYVYHHERSKNPLVVYPNGMDLQHKASFIKEDGKPIQWLRGFTETNSFSSPYLNYGNEAYVGYAYGDVCLVVEVDEAAERVR